MPAHPTDAAAGAEEEEEAEPISRAPREGATKAPGEDESVTAVVDGVEEEAAVGEGDAAAPEDEEAAERRRSSRSPRPRRNWTRPWTSIG